MLTTDLEKIPSELKTRRQWVVWRVEDWEGKPTKVPYNPVIPEKRAKSDDPGTWGTFDKALSTARSGDFSGVGYEFSFYDPYCGVDLDKCRIAETGAIETGAKEIITRLNSYTEISPSGQGVHILVKAKLPPGPRRKGKVEMYDFGRYFTMTGLHLEGTPTTIEDRQDELTALHNEIFGQEKKAPQKDPSPSPSLTLADSEVLTKLRSAKNGKKFSLLERGDWRGPGFPSQSEAELAFVSMLAFYTQDPEQIDRIYRASALCRDKWDRPTAGSTYGAKTIEKALAGTTEFYTQGHRPPVRAASKATTQEGRKGAQRKTKDCQEKQLKSKIGLPEIEELNKKHAVVMLGGRCVILNEVTDPVSNRPDVTFSYVQDFKNYYCNVKVEIPQNNGSFKEIPISTLWLESRQRRTYQGLVFLPGQGKPEFYNLFRGFAIEPKKGNWSLFQNHIKEVIANSNEDIYHYIINWIADLFQNPGGERCGTSIVLRGPQGAGKGCFVTQLGEIIGNHYLQIINQVQLTGRFNSHLKDALLVFCDEGLWAGDRSAEGVLKGMVTEPYILVEPKGKDAFPIKNHIRLIIASNSEWVVPAGLEERRFLVLDISDSHKQDNNYFSAIVSQMDNGGREAMLYDLLQMDISNYDLRKIPRTNALMDQIIFTLPTAQKFWYEKLRAGNLLKNDDEWPNYVVTEKLYSEYVEFANNLGDRYKLINKQFTKSIKKLCPDIIRKRITIESKPKWVLCVPELETCRELFESLLETKINWGDDPLEDPDHSPF